MSDAFKQQPIIVPPGGGDDLLLAGSQLFHKVKSEDTNGVFFGDRNCFTAGKGCISSCPPT